MAFFNSYVSLLEGKSQSDTESCILVEKYPSTLWYGYCSYQDVQPWNFCRPWLHLSNPLKFGGPSPYPAGHVPCRFATGSIQKSARSDRSSSWHITYNFAVQVCLPEMSGTSDITQRLTDKYSHPVVETVETSRTQTAVRLGTLDKFETCKHSSPRSSFPTSLVRSQDLGPSNHHPILGTAGDPLAPRSILDICPKKPQAGTFLPLVMFKPVETTCFASHGMMEWYHLPYCWLAHDFRAALLLTLLLQLVPWDPHWIQDPPPGLPDPSPARHQTRKSWRAPVG